MLLPVMKLTLQPVIENAVLHAFSGAGIDGRILIEAWRENEDVVLTVSDDGLGMEEEKTDEINRYLSVYPPQEDMRSFGLYNVNRRLVETFGAGYGIKVTSEIGEGTTVVIRMPDRNMETLRNNISE